MLIFIYRNPLVETDFTVGVDGADPNPLFVNEPTDEELKDALLDAGFGSYQGRPLLCLSQAFASELDDTPEERAKLEEGLTGAYVQANSGLNADDLQINVTKIQWIDDKEGYVIFSFGLFFYFF